MSKNWLGYYGTPRKRHMPLKRYKVRATLSDGEVVFLVIRERSKKGARSTALKEYAISRAEVVEVLGKSKEDDYFS